MPDAEWRDFWQDQEGGVEEAPNEAAEYLRSWHGSLPGAAKVGFVSVFSLPSTVGASLQLDGLLGAVGSEGLWPVINGSWARRNLKSPQSVYVGAAFQKSRATRGQRGGKQFFLRAPGPWMDADIRPDGFADWSGVVRLIDWFGQVGLPPSIVGYSGAGGHLYWHVGEPGEGLGPEVEEYGQGLRLLAERETGISLDSCENRDRIMRLPGSIHWPKRAGDAPTACTLVRCDVRWAPVERVAELTAGVLGEWRARTRETRALYRARDDRAERDIRTFRALTGAADDDDDSWGRRYELAHAEEEFAMAVSWKSILEDKGWTRNGEPDAEGRQEWARPGDDAHSGRSMITDWVGSPDVASLLSRAPETGLLRLYDAGIALTKARVAAELWTDGDMSRLLTEGMAR